MKVIWVVLMVLVVAGCGKSSREVTDKWVLPKGLEDCKIYRLESGVSGMRVMRCPLSTTTLSYKDGKSNRSTVVIEKD